MVGELLQLQVDVCNGKATARSPQRLRRKSRPGDAHRSWSMLCTLATPRALRQEGTAGGCIMCCPRVESGGEARLSCLSIIYLPSILCRNQFGCNIHISTLRILVTCRQNCSKPLHEYSNTRPINSFVPLKNLGILLLARSPLPSVLGYVLVGWTVTRGSGTDGSDVGLPE